MAGLYLPSSLPSQQNPEISPEAQQAQDMQNFNDFGGGTESTNLSAGSDDSGGGLGNFLSDNSDMLGLAAGSLIGGYFGNQASGAANQTLGNALANYQQIANNFGNKSDYQVALQQAGLANYNPAVLQQSVNVPTSAYANLGPNQQVLAEQQANNAMLQQVTKSGYTPEMIAAYNNMQNATNANAQAQMAGIRQAQAARGMGSSGANLAMQMQAAQNAQNNASTAAGNIAGQGFQNKLAAMSQLGGLTNAQQSQLSSLAAQQAQGLQQNAQYGTTLNADIAAQNMARMNQQQNLQTQAQQQNQYYNTDVQNRQAWQNQVGAEQMALQAQLGAANGQAATAANLAKGQKGQGDILGGAVSGVASGLIGLL